LFIEQLQKKEHLKTLDEEDLRHWIIQMGRERRADKVPVLIDLISGARGGVREAIITSLIQIGGAETVGSVKELLRAEESTLRNSAIEIIESIGEISVPELLPMLKDPDKDVRKFAVDILGNIGHKSAIPALEPLADDPDVNVRAATVEALGKIGDPRGLNILMKALDDKEWVRIYAIESLSKIGTTEVASRLVPLLKDKSPIIKIAVVKALGKIGESDILDTLILLMNDDFPGIKSYIIQAVGDIIDRCGYKISPSAKLKLEENIDSIIECLSDEDRGTREKAELVLAVMKTPRAIESLIESSIKTGEYSKILRDILIRGNGDYIESLLLALDSYTGPEVKFYVEIFGEMGSDKPLPFLYKCLSSSSEDVKIAALNSIIRIGNPYSCSVVKPLLGDSIGHIRRIAAHCMGQMKHVGAIDDLFKLLDDPYEDVRFEAAEAICRINDRSALEKLKDKILLSSDNTRVSVMYAISKFCPDLCKDETIAALHDSNWKVRKYAVSALGDIGTPDVVDHLIFALNDEKDEVRIRAIKALSRYKGKEVVDSLLPLVYDSDIWIRLEAIKELEKFDTPRVREILRTLLDDESPVIQAAVIETMVKVGGADFMDDINKMLDSPDFEVQMAAEEALDQLSL